MTTPASQPVSGQPGRSTVVLPPATLGLLGGGQLGRYFVMAARTMGYRVVVLEPDANAPAGTVANEHIVADYVNPDALRYLAEHCAVVTTEFENAPAEAMDWLAQRTIVAPPPLALAVAQDRRDEKRFLADLALPTAPFVVIETADDIVLAADLPFPAILKTARLGYDGKGQIGLNNYDELAGAWARLDHVACVLEQRMPLQREVSVMIARTAAGATACYPITQNSHVDGILDVSVAPVQAEGAMELATVIANALEYVGVLGVEMFVVDGQLLVNELAPRPHNSYHWTLDAAVTDQFEQQVRAVCGLPLGSTEMTCAAVAMANVLGDLWRTGPPDWALALDDRASKLHLYGKLEARAGRKMGHLTSRSTDTQLADQTVRMARLAAIAG